VYDLLNNNKAFFGKYVNYVDGYWGLDDNDNDYQLDSRFFNCLDENVRLFNFRYSSRGGVRHYYIEPNDTKRFAYYDKFLLDLMHIMAGKTFKTLSQLAAHCIDHNFIFATSKVRFPLGFQGRYDDITCVIIRGRGRHQDHSVFIPYWGRSQSVLQHNKMFKNLVRIFILLYRPDLEYPYAFVGDKRSFEKALINLYSRICEDFQDD
jgi:hypothetical protein